MRRWQLIAIASLVALAACKKTGAGLLKEDDTPPADAASVAPRAIPAKDIGPVLKADAEYGAISREFLALKSVQDPYGDQQRQAFRSSGGKDLPKRKMDDFLVKWDADAQYVKMQSRHAKLLATVAGLLRPFRGILYRAAPIVEKTPALHNMILASEKGWAQSLKVNVPSPQAAVVWQYVAEPYDKDEHLDRADEFTYRFKDINALQSRWLCRGDSTPAGDAAGPSDTPALADTLEKTVARLEELARDRNPIYVDLQLAFGDGSFISDENRYIAMTDVDLRATIAAVKATQHNLLVACAYDLNDAPKFATTIANYFGFAAVTHQIEGLNIDMTMRAIASKDISEEFGKPRTDAKVWMTKAWQKLSDAAKDANTAWDMAKERLDPKNGNIDDSAMINLNTYRSPRLSEQMGHNLEKFQAALAGETTLQSAYYQKTVQVNLKNLYDNPPSFRELLPTLPVKAGQANQYGYPETTNGFAGEDITFRDYFQGNGANWRLDKWRVIFPKLQSDTQVPEAVSIMSQAPGGKLYAGWLSTFVM